MFKNTMGPPVLRPLRAVLAMSPRHKCMGNVLRLLLVPGHLLLLAFTCLELAHIVVLVTTACGCAGSRGHWRAGLARQATCGAALRWGKDTIGRCGTAGRDRATVESRCRCSVPCVLELAVVQIASSLAGDLPIVNCAGEGL